MSRSENSNILEHYKIIAKSIGFTKYDAAEKLYKIQLSENKIVSGFRQTQQYIFILFYLHSMFLSTAHHQAIPTKLRIRCLYCK